MATGPPFGRLVLAATPLGSVGDASARLRAALADSPVIAAEDTRRLRRLTTALDVVPTGRVVSYFEGNEAARIPDLLATLRGGADVLLVTDAGMPSVSDPGYRLVGAAVTAGIEVTVLPGPSAVTAALAVSGLPSDRFCFEGFLPRRGGERARAIGDLVGERRTIVLFESPRRLAATLAALQRGFGDERPAAVCRELTKTYEQVVRGPLSELAAWAASTEVLGEITVVVGGAVAHPATSDPDELATEVHARLAAGASRRDAVAAVAAATGQRRRDVYNASLRPAKASAITSAGGAETSTRTVATR